MNGYKILIQITACLQYKTLTVNDISGTPLIFKKIVKKTANAINMCYQNPLEQLLKQFSKLYQLWGLSSDHYSMAFKNLSFILHYFRGGIQEIHDF